MTNELRHYEVVVMVHPDQSEQVPVITQRYRNLIETNGGAIHRFEDWGRRQLAYPINKLHKAHYILMNIECNDTTLAELKHNFHFSENILRSLVLRRKNAVTSSSAMLQSSERVIKRPFTKSKEEIPAGSIDDSVAPSIDGEQEGNAAE